MNGLRGFCGTNACWKLVAAAAVDVAVAVVANGFVEANGFGGEFVGSAETLNGLTDAEPRMLLLAGAAAAVLAPAEIFPIPPNGLAGALALPALAQLPLASILPIRSSSARAAYLSTGCWGRVCFTGADGTGAVKKEGLMAAAGWD